MYQSLSQGLQHSFRQSTTPASAPLKRETNLFVNFIARRTTVLKHLSLRSHGNAALFLVSSPMQLNGYSQSRRAVTRRTRKFEQLFMPPLSPTTPLAFVDINSHAANNPSHEVSFLKSDLTALSIVMGYDRSILYPTSTMVDATMCARSEQRWKDTCIQSGTCGSFQ